MSMVFNGGYLEGNLRLIESPIDTAYIIITDGNTVSYGAPIIFVGVLITNHIITTNQ